MSLATLCLFKIKSKKMQHEESEIKIFKTKDYSRFRMIGGNRGINISKIDKIVADIEGGNNMLPYKPVEVKEVGSHLEIFDGQHRYFTSKKIKGPVYYVIVREEKSMQEIATINSRVDKWKPLDYLNCYINQCNDNYIRLQQFLDDFKLGIGTSLRLLTYGYPGTGGDNKKIVNEFHSGSFVIEEEEEALRIAEMCRSFSAVEFWRDRYFVIAIYRIDKAALVSMDELRAAVEKNIDKMKRQTNTKAYIYNLEIIMNIGKQKRIVIS